MQFEASTVTLSKKRSNGYGVSGKSAYDGVFATPIKLRAPTLSSRFEDYAEIFVGGEASLGFSIPILEVPELNERKFSDDIRCSKLDYSKVFGDFENLDNAVPYEELLAEPKNKDSFHNGIRSTAKEGNQSSNKNPTNNWKEIPLDLRESSSFNGVKSINMSNHKINKGSESRRNGTMRIAELHDVPADSCTIEEVDPLKMNRADMSISVPHDAYRGSLRKDRIKESEDFIKSVPGPSPASAKKQSSNGGVKVHNRSDSINQFFNACEISHGSDETQHIKVAPSETVVSNFFGNNGDVMRSMETKYQVSKSDASEGDVGADSLPSYLDDMVDLNSEAAASVAVLRKAIEEAQERIKVVKESIKRKKEGFPSRVKQRNNNNLKSEGKGKKEVKFMYKTMKLKESTLWQTFGEMDTFLQVSSEIRKPMMKSEHITPDHMAKSTEVEVREEEVERKETDHKAAVLEFKEAENNRRVLLDVDEYQWNEKCTGSNAFEKPEQSGPKIEVLDEAWEQETNERGKVNAVDEEGRCQERVDETKFTQMAHDYGAKMTRLNVDGNEDIIEKKATPFDELVLEDWERKLSKLVSMNKTEKKIACTTEEDEEKIEQSCELEECQRNSRAHQEPIEFVKKIAQKQKECEEKVDLSSETEECLLREFMELIDNGKAFNQPGLDLKSTERQIEFEKKVAQDQKECEKKVDVSSELVEFELRELLEPIDNEKAFKSRGLDLRSTERQKENLACLDDGRKKKEPDCLDIIQERKHFCPREGTKNMFGNTYVQEVQEDIRNHLHNEEEIHERITKDSESNQNERVQDTKQTEKELDGTTFLTEENERGWKDNSEWLEVTRVTQTGPYYEEEAIKEADKTMETSPNHEPNETQNINKIQVADTNVKNDEAPVVTPEVYAHDKLDNIKVDNAAFKHEDYVKMNQEIDKNQCNSSAEEKVADSEWEDQEIKTSLSRLKENHEATPTMEEKKANGSSQKVEQRKEHPKKVDEAKEREREREKEKLTVERVLCEARERAFAEARERAALERAAAEGCLKNISDGQERLVNTAGLTNEKIPSEKTAIEAKLKADRAAVERATAEARARALERALSEKAASEGRNKSDKFVAEKSFIASRDNGMRQNFYSKSFSHGDVFDGTNDDSAQRCKARFERHQRIGERVAKALAEKNSRDRLVQKEQDERNRVAESLDADVRRWSSGKEGNLRALLSTLHYILGSESGWQPIPLTEIVIRTAVKKAYRKATLFVHPSCSSGALAYSKSTYVRRFLIFLRMLGTDSTLKNGNQWSLLRSKVIGESVHHFCSMRVTRKARLHGRW